MCKYLGMSAAALLLASCGGGNNEGTIETEDGTITYDVDGEGTDVSFSASDEEGNTLEIDSGGGLDVDFPDGYSLYPGASIVTNMNMVRNDMTITNVIFNSADSPEDVAGFYRQQAEAAGIEVNNEAVINGAHVFGGEGPNDATFNISASPMDDGTTAQLSLSSRE